MPEWYKSCSEERVRLVYENKKRILSIYRDMCFDVGNAVKSVFVKTNVGPGKKVYYKPVERSVGKIVNSRMQQMESVIKSGMKQAAEAVMDDSIEFLLSVGFEDNVIDTIEGSREDRIKKLIYMIVTGSFYDKKWTLQRFVNAEYQKIMADFRKIITKCIEQGMDMDEIAENVIIYFNPDKEKKPKFFIMFPGIKHKIAYNFIRVSNTFISHAYQRAFVEMTIKNPFVKAYRWVTSGSDRVCSVCIDRESSDKFGLGPGIFPKDMLPLDHPNGMCTVEPIWGMSERSIIREVGRWKSKTGDMREDIDSWFSDF